MLISLKEINPQGYHNFLVNPFHQFKSMAENAIPEKIHNGTKCHTSMALNAIHNGTKCHTSMAENAIDTISDITDTDNTDSKSFKSSVNKPVNKTCGKCQEFEKNYLDSRGNKSNFCPKILCQVPPALNAESCEHYKERSI